MKKFYSILLIFMLALNGCNAIDGDNSHETAPTTNSAAVDGVAISVDTLNAGIRSVFSQVLYYNKNGQLSRLLNQSVEYDLFFDPGEESSKLPKVYLVVTNAEHPLSTEESPKLYKFGIFLTEQGLQSDFCEQSYVHPQKYKNTSLNYLGNYTLQIKEITSPVHEKMSDQWKQQAEAAIRLYMDKNDFYSEKERNLQPGKYSVYIQGFSESDADSNIVFIHENGQVYMGRYYFVHEITEGKPADLNHVELVKDAVEGFEDYLAKLQQNAALSMEYKTD